MTALTGSASSGGAPLERAAELADGASVQTGRDGACSLLVDEDAALEVCQDTSLRLVREGGAEGPRVLELRSGEVRVVAAPRGEARRIEIRTPAAVATLLGAVAYVAVDPRGATTIASAESRVRVESASGEGDPIELAAGQQVAVQPGAPLPRAASKWAPGASAAGGCLVDFHALAFDAARGPGDERALDAITARDAAGALPSVGAAKPGAAQP